MSSSTDLAVREPAAAPRRPRAAGARATHRWRFVPWLMLLPGLAVVITFIVLPFGNTLRLAFTDATLLRPGRFIGLDNFTAMLTDTRLHQSLTVTML